MVRVRILTKIQEASLVVQTQSWNNYEYNRQARAAKNKYKNQMKPAVGSKKLVRGLDLNDDEDWDATRLLGTTGGRGGK